MILILPGPPDIRKSFVAWVTLKNITDNKRQIFEKKTGQKRDDFKTKMDSVIALAFFSLSRKRNESSTLPKTTRIER